MKIIQVINSLGNGGAEKFVIELSNELSLNHHVIICSFKKIEESMFFVKKKRESIKLISLFKKKGFDVSVYFKLFKLFKTEKPNVVHFHLDSTIRYIIPIMLFFPKIKFVHTIHSDLNDEKRQVFSALKSTVFIAKKIRFVCIAESINEEFKQIYPKFKFQLITNGIEKPATTTDLNKATLEVNNLKPDTNTKVFIAIGRIDENKNHRLLINVFNELKNENSIALIIGDDPSNGKLFLKNLQENNAPNVFFIGPKNNVADYLSLADAFVMPSLKEGSPITVIEAMSLKLPVICTPAGGLIDIVEDEKNGFISRDFSKGKFKELVTKFLKLSAEKIQEIKSNNYHKFNDSYTIQACAKKYLNVYGSN